MRKHPIDNNGFAYDSVEEFINSQSKNLPVRWSEILARVDKSCSSIHRELNYLVKMGIVDKKVTDVFGFKITFYRKTREEDMKVSIPTKEQSLLDNFMEEE